MKKFSLRVSGSRVGTVARPIEDGPVVIAPQARLGLRVHRAIVQPVQSPIDINDYASLEDYER